MKPQHTQTYGTQSISKRKTHTSKKKLERAYTSSLTEHLEALELKKQIHSRGVEGRKQ
jgi:hypothetical protein